MNHPSHEEWMAYLYDEMEASARESAEAHLGHCPACQEALARWRRTMAALDSDQISLPGRRVRRWTQAVPWAAAASVALGLGFLGGRLNGMSQGELENRLARARQEILTESRTQQQADLQRAANAGISAGTLENRQLLAEVTKLFTDARVEDRRVWIATLQQLEDQRLQELAGLRDDVLSLARHTGSGFRQTESQLNLLASFLPSGGGTDLPTRQQPINTTNDEK